MKKRPVKTKEQIKKDIRFIRFGPIYFKRFKKLMPGRATKETLIMALAALWSNLEKITFKVNRWNVKHNGYVKREIRKYPNIPAYNHFNKYPRKILAGIYGSTLQIARKEGLLN